MDAPDSSHPTDQVLRAHGIGKLYGSFAVSVHSHLSECGECRERVAVMSADTFLSSLPEGQPRPDSPEFVERSSARRSLTEDTSSAQAAAPLSAPPPELVELPDFEILGELGRGGMGVVYLALNKLMGRNEVLKVVNLDRLDRRGARDRFLREIQSAAQLHHPNIVIAYSAIRAGKTLVFAMEYVEGHDLSQLVKRDGPLPVAHACNFIYQAALGLQFAHEHGLVHRDIKPSNLILARHGKQPVVKVLDFGLAKATRDGPMDKGLTHEGQILGTPDFMAPEQSRGAHKADTRADIYSLGCTLYYLLSGGAPFQAASLYELLQAHHSMEPTPLNLVRPEVPWELAALVAKMMAKEPDQRFQTPAEVAQALTPFFEKASALVQASEIDSSQSSQPEAIDWALTPVPGEAQPAVVEKLRRLSPRAVWAAAALLLFGVAVALALALSKVKTADDRIAPENAPENAVKSATAPESFENSIGMTFKLIPEGAFMMGTPNESTDAGHSFEKPLHRARISKPFYLGVHEVTQAEYKAVMGQNPSHFAATGPGKDKIAGQSTEQYPVEGVSWLNAVLFCNILSETEGKKPFYEIDADAIRVPDWNGPGYRLPTEAEWEFACRSNAPAGARWSFGDSPSELGEYAWFSDNSDSQTHPVCQKKANGLGLFDMHGNVAEWCWDWYVADYYSRSTPNDPTGSIRASIVPVHVDGYRACRIFRGGNCMTEPGYTRSASRNWNAQEYRTLNVGFRLALSQSGR
jgi:serine/threonine protein kinase